MFKANPTVNQSISSRFGTRVDPKTFKVAYHNGVDLRPVIRGKDGDNVYAVADGTISVNKINFGGIKKGYGYYIVVQHNGFATLYGHLMERSPLKVGTTVKAGQIVGKMGNSGSSTGTHLHFGVCLGNYVQSFSQGKVRWSNPELYFLTQEEILMANKQDKPSSWAVDAIKWAKANNISDGTRPKDPCTREEVIVMLERTYNLIRKG